MIQYDIGDKIILSKDQKSKCWQAGVLINRVIGGIEDYMVTPDGRYVGKLDHLFEDAMNVKEAWMIQNKKLADEIQENSLRTIHEEYYIKKVVEGFEQAIGCVTLNSKA